MKTTKWTYQFFVLNTSNLNVYGLTRVFFLFPKYNAHCTLWYSRSWLYGGHGVYLQKKSNRKQCAISDINNFNVAQNEAQSIQYHVQFISRKSFHLSQTSVREKKRKPLVKPQNQTKEP